MPDEITWVNGAGSQTRRRNLKLRAEDAHRALVSYAHVRSRWASEMLADKKFKVPVSVPFFIGGAREMVQSAGLLNVITLDTPTTGAPSLYKTLTHSLTPQADKTFAAEDAEVILTALDSNLDWLERVMTSDARTEYEDDALHEALDVCRQLTKLLGGAIGCCSSAPEAFEQRCSTIDLAALVLRIQERMAESTGVSQVIVAGCGGEGVRVKVDLAAIDRALGAVADGIAKDSCGASSVVIASARRGSYAVIGLTFEGGSLSCDVADKSQSAPLAVEERPGCVPLSKLLLDQGGFLDVELGADGAVVLYVVLRTEQGLGPDVASAGTILEMASPSDKKSS